MPERHYTDDEVAAIFRAAAEGTDSHAVVGDQTDGLTLPDLQSIAREVGLSPLAVARAARELDNPPHPVVSRTFLGLPVAVERTVALDRPLTDPEWERLVVELRQIFHARGTVRAAGSLREWSNGNLQALIEPTPTGYQLRLGTVKGNARASIATGALALGIVVFDATVVGAHGALPHALPAFAVLGTVAAALLANGTIGLSRWARRRREQFDAIVARLTASREHP